FILH
ncbi:acyl transferase domain protein, partial [Chlamydia psittaci 84-8471/1]